MKTPEALLKLFDEYEPGIFTVQSFGSIAGEALGEWRPHFIA